MAATAMSWPAALPPRQVDFYVDQPSRSGGASISGSELIVVSPAGRWRASVMLNIRGEASNLALRAILAQLGGRAGTILVPKREIFRPVDRNGRPMSQANAASYGDNEFNFDLSGWGQEDDPHATVATLAAQGATQLAMNLQQTEGPRPGHYFGLGNRIYRCSHSWQQDVGGVQQVQFWPRLREAATAGTPAVLDKPVCLMRLAADDAGQAALSKRGSGMITLDFVEAI